MIKGNSRIYKRNPPEYPLLTVQQKPVVPNQTNDTGYLQVKLFGTEGYVCDTP